MKKLFLILFIVNCSLPIVNSQWIQQSVPVTMPITGIKFININTGWACTGKLTSPLPSDTSSVIKTINGGTNWLEILRAPAVEFTDLEVVDQDNVNVSGYDLNIGRMKLYKSTNGGTNWNVITLLPNQLINDMQFISKDSAWECGASAGPDVRTTTDGGNTWIVRTSGIMSATQRIFFLNYNTGFCGAGTFLYKTTNTGLNWSIQGSFSTLVQSIFFLNIDTGWVGLSPTTTAHIGYTSNGGLNWSIQNLEPYNLNINSIFFFNNTIGFAGIAFNKIYKTTNSGNLWGYQNNNSGSNRISFIDTSSGWSGWNGISKTTNGGGPITYVGINHVNTEIPNKFCLYQNYPNPFNPQTTIKVDIPKAAYVSFIIFDILGKLLYKEDDYLRAGTYEVNWDASNYPSGVYFYKLITEGFTESKKMILIK